MSREGKGRGGARMGKSEGSVDKRDGSNEKSLSAEERLLKLFLRSDLEKGIVAITVHCIM